MARSEAETEKFLRDPEWRSEVLEKAPAIIAEGGVPGEWWADGWHECDSFNAARCCA